MKAIDIITPGDYEVRPYKGGERRVTIHKVEKRTVRAYVGSRDVVGHNTEQLRAVHEYDHNGTRKELLYPLGQVIRPWAVAAPEHEAAAAKEAKAERIRATLEAILNELGIEVEAYFGHRSKIGLDLTPEQAVQLTNLLRVAGEGRAV